MWIRTSEEGRRTTVHVYGPLTRDTAPTLDDHLAHTLVLSDVPEVAVDLRRCTDADVGGLRALDRARQVARQRGSTLVLVGVPPLIEHVLHRHDFGHLLKPNGVTLHRTVVAAASTALAAPVDHAATTAAVLDFDPTLRAVDRLAEAARAMQQRSGVQEVLQAVVTQAVHVVAGCESASVAMSGRDKTIETVATSSSLAARADALQYQCGEGPVVDTIRRHETTQVDDLVTDRRWSSWRPRAHRGLALRSELSVTFCAEDNKTGSVNLYSRRPAAFSAADRAVAVAFSAVAGLAIAAAERCSNLCLAMENRTVIGQAQGLLMERYDVGADQAFETLRRVSQQSNTKLYDVGDEFVRTRRTPGT